MLAKEPKVAGGQRLTEPQVMTASDKEVRMRCAACRDGYWYLRSTWGPFWLGEHKGGVPSFDPPVTEGADDLVDAVK